jgi:hypothetical protein
VQQHAAAQHARIYAAPATQNGVRATQHAPAGLQPQVAALMMLQ